MKKKVSSKQVVAYRYYFLAPVSSSGKNLTGTYYQWSIQSSIMWRRQEDGTMKQSHSVSFSMMEQLTAKGIMVKVLQYGWKYE